MSRNSTGEHEKGQVCSEEDKTGLMGSSHTGQQQEQRLEVHGNQRPGCRTGVYFFQQRKAVNKSTALSECVFGRLPWLRHKYLLLSGNEIEQGFIALR